MKLMPFKKILLTLLAVILLGMYLVPVFWMFSSSFKSEKDIVSLKWLPSKAKLDNYTIIVARAKIGRWFLNSVIAFHIATIF